MFHPEKIQSIKPDEVVLEVGPGSLPYPRSNVLLERRFGSDQIAYAQRGYTSPITFKQPIIYYDGGKFPFKNKEFDYVICSHVIEHVPAEELQQFIAELQRVSSKGYIEFPNVFYELICYQDVHKWFMNYRNGNILFLNKSNFKSNFIHKIYRESFYGKDTYLYQSFSRFKDFFFVGYEWFYTINYDVVNKFDDLVDQSDFEFWKKYFSESHMPDSASTEKPFVKRLARFLKRHLIKFKD